MSSALSPAQVFLAVEPVDIRLGVDGLSLRVQQSLGRTPTDGSAYAFRNRAGNRIKLLVWDGNGVWLCVRRLHTGRFVWPQSSDQLFTCKSACKSFQVSGVIGIQ
ncbi:IS66 family insertion sequence element accessory protein TnpB [Parachitinimonas caeni]|uniref:IS66 family insertion sequence element accessory protein TnpB n=1 Tax=Parachitinimonas caeni TaxID=3031301 RepID=A0ABT7E080_9NEIS|nr:IS66 family insertion sequence element accessory protein TnpB [Parachitinimonas caeni]MDK2125484.1 IS66 family insertion sequence element accessory protein TnpB [Parachitinimonas caeni]